ncbi:unnamed protein product [Ceutorhynchus assimilis]|uniref:Uncharacterized protein n=1 Tax=Ceutorhynchus assimilis TaxID=467358 RepID=A0A9N9MTS1_9CUCU|nr:unnamed protein product [Ceutorhynchus assimilis]
MNLYVQFFAVLCLFNSVSSQNASIELTDTKSTYSWKPTDATSIQVSAEDGYQIQVDALKVDIDGENGDYIEIKSATEDTNLTLIFTYTVSGKPSYLYNTNKIEANYVASNKSNSFLIQFTRVGEIATTTPEPSSTTTTPAMPTASPEESPSLTVYIHGKAAADFRADEIDKLRGSIADMGQKYCADQNCPLNESITTNNVKINSLRQCPLFWNNYESCINLTFALPIVKMENVKTDSLWDGYQLNEANLKLMWENYAREGLETISLDLYSQPNVESIFNVRLIVIGIVVVVLVIIVLIFGRFVGKLTKRRRKLSDTVSIIDRQVASRTSQLSLTPHYLQELPPLFSNDFLLHPDQRSHNKLFTGGYTNDSSTSGPSNLINLSTKQDADDLFEDTNA